MRRKLEDYYSTHEMKHDGEGGGLAEWADHEQALARILLDIGRELEEHNRHVEQQNRLLAEFVRYAAENIHGFGELLDSDEVDGLLDAIGRLL